MEGLGCWAWGMECLVGSELFLGDGIRYTFELHSTYDMSLCGPGKFI